MAPQEKPPSQDPSTSLPFPAPGWTRYENVEFLGAGGMGRVFKARDPRLNRVVALKFLRDNDPEQVRRLLREAKAQASIDHTNICKVYEVGEAAGQSYIAMQYIEGRSLREMKGEISIDAKIEIMRKVAEAMHEAHRLGVIHRDIKLANIMLESGDGGALRPYIMDFGLAQVADAAGDSRVGLVEGTPAYMSPEQAQGQTGRLDRRTDVYSIGACLYELLVDRPPFVGAGSLDVIMKLIHEEPAPLRAQNAAVPPDLEAIVLKCLEKEPERRYDSARALAEDLKRYLDGEPVLAQRASLGYRLLKKARKNKPLVAVAGVALAAVLALAGFGVRMEVRAGEQARLAQQLGHDVEAIESFLRFAYSMPVHDIGPEKDAVREKMAAIAQRMERVGAIGQGPGQYALGRGHLVLHEYDEALARLTAAEKAGYSGPELERAIGQALGGLYQREMDEAQRIADRDARDARKKEIESKYLLPALQHIQKSGGPGVDAPAHVEALTAFYEKRYDQAASQAREAADRSPWLYEARALEGAAHFQVGSERHERGDDEGALGELGRAAEAYERAADVARSDGDVQEALAEVWISIMQVQTDRGKDPKAAFDKALAAADRALAINGRSANAFSKKSRAHWLAGERAFGSGDDPRPAYQKAISFGRDAVRLNPRDAVTYDNIGNAATAMGAWEDQHGLDPRASFDVAIEAYQRSIDQNPAFAWAWNDMGTAEQSKADYEARRGFDYQPALKRAIELYKRAIEVDPSYSYPYSNMGFAYATLALHDAEQGKDSRPLAALGVDACRAAVERSKSHGAALVNMGHAQLAGALYELVSGLDPRPSLEAALDTNRKAIEIKPADLEAHQNITNAHRMAALYLLGQGADPGEPLSKARAAAAKMLEIDANAPRSLVLSAQVDLVAARLAMKKGQDPSEAFRAAEASLRRAAAQNPLDPTIHEAAAEVARYRAEHQLGKKEPADATIEHGLLMVDKALAIHQGSQRALALRGALYLFRARGRRDRAEAAEDARLAVAAFEQGLRDNPALQRELGPLRTEAEGLLAR
jgi:serine/threonine-protein kinase